MTHQQVCGGLAGIEKRLCLLQLHMGALSAQPVAAVHAKAGEHRTQSNGMLLSQMHQHTGTSAVMTIFKRNLMPSEPALRAYPGFSDGKQCACDVGRSGRERQRLLGGLRQEAGSEA